MWTQVLSDMYHFAVACALKGLLCLHIKYGFLVLLAIYSPSISFIFSSMDDDVKYAVNLAVYASLHHIVLLKHSFGHKTSVSCRTNMTTKFKWSVHVSRKLLFCGGWFI